jgi:hypothetical protein
MAIVNSPSTYAGFPIGLEVAKCDVILQAHADVTAGDVVAISPSDITDDRFTKTQATASDNASIDDNEFGVFAVALEDIDVSVNAYGKFRVQGVVTCLVNGTTDVAAGNALQVEPTTENLELKVDVGAKIVAFALEASTDNSANLTKVMFDGLNGFGQLNA